MKNMLLLIGILAVLGQTHGDCLQEVIEGKPHNTYDMCSRELNWALIAHPHDCHKFYVCANRVPEEFSCAENYFFDPKKRRCVLGSCSEIKECQSWVRRVEEDCHAFEICENGNFIREYCPRHRYFIEESTICAPITNSPQHKCSCILPPHSVLKNPENCASFYSCINGKAVLQQCPRGMYFDAFLSACVEDIRGVCHVIPPPPTDEENNMSELCKRLVLSNDDTINTGRLLFQPDANDCSKFYLCDNGRVITKRCPQGFFFNRELRFCEVDKDGLGCAIILEQAKKKKEQMEKEASIKEEDKHHKNELSHQHAEEEHKSSVELNLSMTHVKLGVEKNTADAKHTDTGAIKLTHGGSPIGPVPAIILPHLGIKPSGEQDKEASFNHALDGEEHKQSATLSFSGTHAKLDVEKNNADTKHTDTESIKVVQNGPVVVPVPAIIVPHLEAKTLEENENELSTDQEEMINNSAEVQEINSVEMKLPLSELKLPTNSNYEKLASKFMAF